MTTISPSTPTVFVVDDDADLRHSLQSLIQALGHAVRTFASAAQFRHYYRAPMSGCLLLDVHMPRQSGLELYEQLLQEGRRLPAIFITAHAEVSTAVAAMKTGAIEFLEKPFERVTLERLLNKALALDAQWRQQEAQLAQVDAKISRLTDRERRTLQMILDGCSNKVMAARLDLTERAIEMRRASIMRKLDVESIAELLNLAVTHRVLSDVRRLRDQNGFAR